MNNSNYSGLHLMANLHQVDPETAALRDQQACRMACINAVTDSGLSIVGDFFHGFGVGYGVTGVVVLSESHVAIHTWPESSYVTLDVFVCNHHRDNTDRARHLFETLIGIFTSAEVKRFEVIRE
jgi:S-adenosylmethionine decarboxylase